MRKDSNYEIMKRQMQEVFARQDLAQTAEKWHLGIKDNIISVRFIARDYTINAESGIVLRADTGVEADYNEAMTLYDILSREPAVPFDTYVSVDSFSRLHSASGNAGSFGGAKRAFDHQEAKLSRACEILGGAPFGKADVGCKLPVFQRLNVILQFWNSDDEFDSELKFLCDQNTMSFMTFETLMFMLGHLINRLCEEMSNV